MASMKKTIFFTCISIYSSLILVLSSELYLIGGSNVIEFVYSMFLPVKIVVIFALFAFGYMSFFIKKNNIFSKLMFALIIFLSFVSSQSIVYSGKNNSIDYHVYGFSVNKINLDPTDEGNVVINSMALGFVRVSKGDMSFTYMSLFCPFCLDASEMKNL